MINDLNYPFIGIDSTTPMTLELDETADNEDIILKNKLATALNKKELLQDPVCLLMPEGVLDDTLNHGVGGQLLNIKGRHCIVRYFDGFVMEEDKSIKALVAYQFISNVDKTIKDNIYDEWKIGRKEVLS